MVSLRSEGLTGLRVLAIGSTDGYDIDFPEPIYSVGLDSNPEYQHRPGSGCATRR